MWENLIDIIILFAHRILIQEIRQKAKIRAGIRLRVTIPRMERARDRSGWVTHLVDELQAALVLGALVGELDGVQRKGRGGGEHDRGGGGEGRSLRVGTKHESVSGQSSGGAIPR